MYVVTQIIFVTVAISEHWMLIYIDIDDEYVWFLDPLCSNVRIEIGCTINT